jgi:solute carrier family 25 citrate transporter 1
MSTSNSKSHSPTPPIVSLISGGIAGGVEGFLTYPFEFAKTRMQLRSKTPNLPPQKTSRNPYAIVLQIYRTEGLPALYKGCSALVFGSVAKDAVRFLSFDTVKNAFRDKETGTLTTGNNMLAGMTAGVVASLTAVTPTERIKTALIDDARQGGSHRYKSNTHCIKLIIAEDGFRGLYRGLVGTTLKQASATSFRMGSYNIIKDFEERRGVRQGTGVNFMNGAIAGVVTTVLSQPFDTVKTRSQAAEVTTTVQAVVSVLKEDGVRAFWRGTVMRLSRTVFSGGE